MEQSAVKQRMEIKTRKKGGFFKSKLLQSFRGAAPGGEKKRCRRQQEATMFQTLQCNLLLIINDFQVKMP